MAVRSERETDGDRWQTSDGRRERSLFDGDHSRRVPVALSGRSTSHHPAQATRSSAGAPLEQMNPSSLNSKVPVVFFTKHFQGRTIDDLVREGPKLGCEGYDLCCRAGHAVNPENVRAALPKAAKQLRDAGLVVPMVTGDGHLLEPT